MLQKNTEDPKETKNLMLWVVWIQICEWTTLQYVVINLTFCTILQFQQF